MISPFQIPWDPGGLADLKHRLGATRWSDAVVSDLSYGVERGVSGFRVSRWSAALCMMRDDCGAK